MSEVLPYDHVQFEIFCMEIYRAAKRLAGPELVELFDRYDVFSFIEDCGDTLHCQGEQAIIADIDEYILRRAADFNANGKLGEADYQALREMLKEKGLL